MMKKQAWVSLGLATAVGLSAIIPVGNAVHVEAASGFPFNAKAKAQYDKIVPLMKKAEKSKSEKDVTMAYQEFIKITRTLNGADKEVYKPGNDLDKLYERLKKLMLSMPKTYQNKHIPIMADKWADETRYSRNSIARYYLEEWIRNNKNPNISKKLMLVKRKLNLYSLMTNPTDSLPKGWDKDDSSLKKEIDNKNKGGAYETSENMPKPPNATTSPSGSGTNNTGSSGSSGGSGGTSGGSNSSSSGSTQVGQAGELVQVGKTWYEVQYRYTNGKPKEISRVKLTPKSNPELYGFSSSSSASSGSYNNQALLDRLGKEQAEYLTQDQNSESEYTIQYSLDKQGEKPYYFDTGLRVDKKNNASYEQYKDVLYQIAVKSGGYTVEDKGRILIVIDKKPIIVNDVKKSYSENEIESLFEAFPNIDIRILKTRIGASTSLEEQIVSKQAKVVKVNGKKIELTSTPIVRESRVLLPLKEVVKALGAKVKQDEDKFIVTKGSDTIVYQLKNTKVVSKGKTIDIGVAPDVKDNTLYVEMSELANIFNYDLTWDGDNSELSFNNRDDVVKTSKSNQKTVEKKKK